MLVPLPFVLLLLDYWPLGRLGGAGKGLLSAKAAADGASVPAGDGAVTDAPGRVSPFARAILEKIPLLVPVALACLMTVFGQGNVPGINRYFTWWWRVGNALISYASYLGQSFYPVGLAAHYPRRGPELPAVEAAAAAVSCC